MTRTPTLKPGQAKTLYVRMSGSDSNSGTSPGSALQTVGQAARLLTAGTTVYVGPGHYTEPPPATPGLSGRIAITGVTGTASAPIQLIGDRTGSHTGDAPGEVILDANGDIVTLIITKAPFVTIDGFTITGALPQAMPKTNGVEIEARSNSNNVTIRNCVIGQSPTSDGIRIDGSTDVLIFDNLLFQDDRGILITGGATGARIINNTIVTARTGLALSQKNGVAPTGATVTNNIFESQGNNLAISVSPGPPTSQDGYTGDFNLVFEADPASAYSPADIRGANDINTDALLVDLATGDVHLGHGSPAIDKGSDDIGASLVGALTQRTTQADGSLDNTPVDMGYHYP